jgi:hypothetical protein
MPATSGDATGAAPERPTYEGYAEWLKTDCGHIIDVRATQRYEAATAIIQDAFRRSPFWGSLLQRLPDWDAQYQIDTGYVLFGGPTPAPEINRKPYESFLLKTFRKNVTTNAAWPDHPPDGWLFPPECLPRINDNVRTRLVARYLDGVKYIADSALALASEQSLEAQVDYEAKEDGYYAAHLYVIMEFQIPTKEWDLEKVAVPIEIQITTQVQDLIQRLLHIDYTQRRLFAETEGTKWQWDYRGQSFSVNYLGHILHYVEGMIMDIRERQPK